MVSLGEISKLPKICQKPFYKNATVVLCKKPLTKTPNIRKIRQYKAIALAKAIAFARWPIFRIVSFLEYLAFWGAVFCTEQL